MQDTLDVYGEATMEVLPCCLLQLLLYSYYTEHYVFPFLDYMRSREVENKLNLVFFGGGWECNELVRPGVLISDLSLH